MPAPIVIGAGLLATAVIQLIRAVLVAVLNMLKALPWRTILEIVFAIATLNWEAVKQYFEEWSNAESTKALFIEKVTPVIVAYAQEHLGITLDAENPLSTASLSNAIGQKIGVPLTNIVDREQTMLDIGGYVAQQMNVSYGTSFTNVWPLADFPNQLMGEIPLAIDKVNRGVPQSFITPAHVGAIAAAINMANVVIPQPNAKMLRKRALHRIAQRKYAAKYYRAGQWVPRPVKTQRTPDGSMARLDLQEKIG